MKTFGVFGLAAILASALHAGIIYDNTAGAVGGEDRVIAFGPLYDSFTSAADVEQITNLVLILTDEGLPPIGTLDIGLYANITTGISPFNAPGALIASLGTLSDTSLTSSPAEYDISLTANPTLAPSTRYWIGLSGSTEAYWTWSTDITGVGVAGEFFSNKNGTYPNTDGPYQMALTTTAPATTPEPASVLLILTGLGTLGLLRRRVNS